MSIKASRCKSVTTVKGLLLYSTWLDAHYLFFIFGTIDGLLERGRASATDAYVLCKNTLKIYFKSNRKDIVMNNKYEELNHLLSSLSNVESVKIDYSKDHNQLRYTIEEEIYRGLND